MLEANELAFDLGDVQEEVIVNKLIAVNDLLGKITLNKARAPEAEPNL